MKLIYAEKSPVLAQKGEVNGFSEMKGKKMLVKHLSLRVSSLGILQKKRLP